MIEIAVMLSIFASIFAIIDPIGNVPLFIAMTQNHSKDEKIKVINKVIIVATLTLVIFGLVGQYIFMLFHITIPAFQIAGGILIFKIGFDMLQGGRPSAKRTEDEKQQAIEREVIGIVPLGIPIFAGPGSISAVMLYISQHQASTMDSFLQLGIVLSCVFLTMAISYVLLRNATKIFDWIGQLGTLAISRIMGLLITAMAIQFLLNGFYTVLINWGMIS